MPLWRSLHDQENTPGPAFLPLPEIQIFGGGAHAGSRVDVQDYMVTAVGAETWLIYAPDDWHLLGTDRYPFYPHMRTFARAFDGWDQAIRDVAAALAERASG